MGRWAKGWEKARGFVRPTGGGRAARLSEPRAGPQGFWAGPPGGKGRGQLCSQSGPQCPPGPICQTLVRRQPQFPVKRAPEPLAVTDYMRQNVGLRSSRETLSWVSRLTAPHSLFGAQPDPDPRGRKGGKGLCSFLGKVSASSPAGSSSKPQRP